MELQVTITLSDRLFGLLEDKLPNLGRRVEKAITKELSAQARRESNITVDVAAVTGKPESSPDKETSDAPETVENPEPRAAEAPAETAPEAEAITPERARKHLKETRRRLLGENYEDQKGTAPYKAITSLAKQIILLVSENRADAIPKLSDEERKRFMEECDALIIGEDGMPCFPPAPY